jgi:uncharacterized protein (TIGR02996 family)
MNDEEIFNAGLDREPKDAVLRLLFAEWLAERGDERSTGYRWLAAHHKHPYFSAGHWEWWHADSFNDDAIKLPDTVWKSLSADPNLEYPRCKEFSQRCVAEEAAARVIG